VKLAAIVVSTATEGQKVLAKKKERKKERKEV